MPSEPSRAADVSAIDGGDRRCPRASDVRRLVVCRDGVQKCRRRHEEQIAGHGAAEIQQPVVVAGRPADEHVLEHLLDGARRAAVADEIGAEFALCRRCRTACCRAGS